MTDHLGNVLATVLDRKTGAGTSGTGLYDHWAADLASTADYYPGGMMMPGRNTEYDWSRMGSQSQQKDDEVYGKGNTYAFKYRMEDARINRFFSVDPLHGKYPHNSDYAFAENRLIDGGDLEGLEYISRIKPVEQTGTAADYFWAVENGLRDIGNSVPELWNGMVNSYFSLKRGTYLHDLGNEIRGTRDAIKAELQDPTTPTFKQFSNYVTSPQAMRDLTSVVALTYFSRIKLPTINTTSFGITKFRSMTTLQARQWYLSMEAKITSFIDKSASLEVQAKQAFDTRNTIRTFARELMSDRKAADLLYKTDPNMTWEQVMKKYKGDYNEIIKASTRSRQAVNESLGLPTPKSTSTN